MFFFKKYYVNTTEEVDAISIIHELRYAIRDSRGPDGLVTVIVPDPGAGIVIMTPIKEAIEELKATLDVFGSEAGVAKDKIKREREIGPLIQSALIGRTVHIPFQDGNLLLEPYEEVFLFDFMRKKGRREFVVQVISEVPEPERRQPPKKGR